MRFAMECSGLFGAMLLGVSVTERASNDFAVSCVAGAFRMTLVARRDERLRRPARVQHCAVMDCILCGDSLSVSYV